MEPSPPPSVLVTCVLDGTDKWRKVLNVNTIEEIVETAKRSLTCPAELHRFLMFNSSFEEFVDTDISGNVAQLGKYQILFHSKKEEDAVNQTQLVCIYSAATHNLYLL